MTNVKNVLQRPRTKKILIFLGLAILAILLGQLAAVLLLKAMFTI